MRWLLVFAMGCGFHRGTAAVAGDGAGDVAVGDVPRGDGLPGDRDGDGVPDATDNCPDTPNTPQWDEDSDGIGNECDPCPQIAAVQTDSDGDGIGDDCDPHPSKPGDKLVVFEGFDGSSAAGATLEGDGTWTISGGVLAYQFVTDVAGDVRWPITAGAHTIDTAVTISGVTTVVAATISATAMTDFDPGPAIQFDMCGVRYNTGAHDTWHFSDPVWTQLGSMAAPVVLGTSYRIVSRSEGGNVNCSAPPVQIQATASHAGTWAGVRARNMTATFAYVAIYQ